MKEKFAVIFDMDGVITDNNKYHEFAWKEFCKKHDIYLSDEEIHDHVFGRIAKDTLEYIFNKELSVDEIDAFVEEKELIYRDIYKDHIIAVQGLEKLLGELRRRGVRMALATSAPTGNVDFTFSFIPFRDFFDFILDATNISRGKPDPEIYLKAINQLELPANKCLVFEDSKSGIQSALSAGAAVVGLATTHAPEELNGVKRVIKDFTEISYDEIYNLINK